MEGRTCQWAKSQIKTQKVCEGEEDKVSRDRRKKKIMAWTLCWEKEQLESEKVRERGSHWMWGDCNITLSGPLWDSHRRSTLQAACRKRKLCQHGKHTREEGEMNKAEKNAVSPQETKWEVFFLLAQTLCRKITEKEDERRWQRISKERDAGGKGVVVWWIDETQEERGSEEPKSRGGILCRKIYQ